MSSNVQRTSAAVQRPLEWMRFEPVKFVYLVDELSRSQVGTVMKLMLRLWEFGPMSEAAVRSISGDDFAAIRSRMLEADGTLSFEMVEEARAYGKRAQKQRVEAGISSAAKRSDRSTVVQRPLNDRSTGVLSMSVSDSVSKSNSKSEKKERASEPDTVSDDFEALWIVYERYGAKGKALAYYRKLAQEDRDAIHAKAAEYVASTPGCEYRKQLEGWINPDNRLWERPIVKRTTATNGQQTDEQRRQERNRIIAERYAGQ